MTFDEMNLKPEIKTSLSRLKFTTPTDIQSKSIPVALEGKDIIGSAQTGTGKTLAFLLPIVSGLLDNKDGKALIVEPTRELAQQVLNNVRKLLDKDIFVKYVLLIGGEPFFPQTRNLKHNPRLIIGTPGRIIDHIQRESLDLSQCKYLVLDETDRMFEMGFYEQLEKIFGAIPEERQTLMFSATFPKEVERLALQHMHNPERIFVQNNEQANVIADNLVQEEIRVDSKSKYSELVNQLNQREGTVIVFVKTKADAEYIANKLFKDGFTACAMHGDLRQRTRERNIRDFRSGRYRIMVGTDVIARGLDVPHVKHVINYSIPLAPEDYIHRIGRTARAGADGYAVSFISDEDKRPWQAIQEMLHPELKKERINENEKRRFGRGGKRFSKFGDKRFGNRKFRNFGGYHKPTRKYNNYNDDTL